MKVANETVGTANVLVEFGKAIKALKQGKRVQRKGWNGKGLFVFEQVPSSVPANIVPKMTSLPQSVKDEFQRRKLELPIEQQGDFDIRYRNQMAIVYPDNTIHGWVPSPSDVLSEDWIII